MPESLIMSNGVELKGEIHFFQACLPPLPPGDYRVKVEQELKTVGEAFAGELPFAVGGPRFFLDPADIYSVYPPAGHTGLFNNSLPHVVITRRTLPWERTLDGEPHEPGRPVPWMALLVLSPRDFDDGKIPPLKARKIIDLIEPGAGIKGPEISASDSKVGLALARHEPPNDLCNTIDLSRDLYASIVPSKEDLEFLAHVRRVETTDKETLAYLSDGWVSVVLANRFPQSAVGEIGSRNTACLVSLEGLEDCLHGGKWIEEETVRLAVLASWVFTCRGNNTFKVAMTDLKDGHRHAGNPDSGCGLLSLPLPDPEAGDAAAPRKRRRGEKVGDHKVPHLPLEGMAAVRQAVEQGYVGLNHSLRLGEKTVSWYRGPLVPLYLTRWDSYEFLPCADAALRYDYRTGLLDASYAAAWQLGRLLALQKRSFAEALYRYRKTFERQVAVEKREARAKQTYGVVAQTARNFLERHAVKMLVSNAQAALGVIEVGGARSPKEEEHSPRRSVDLPVPEEISGWLARTMLLYGVPFNYLVPDERMLPRESIRFFYLDPAWLNCLLEGASSVGRTATREEEVDQHLSAIYLDAAQATVAQLRSGAKQAREADHMETPKRDDESKVPIADQPATVALQWPLTGFLMRSRVVEGWQGLEMTATGVDGVGKKLDVLQPLRIDRLSPDVLLAIFNGKLTGLTVKQPPEGMHFGASPVPKERKKPREIGAGEDHAASTEAAPAGAGIFSNRFEKLSLRRVHPKAQAGDQLPGKGASEEEREAMRLELPMRERVEGVVRVAELAEGLKAKLTAVNAIEAEPVSSPNGTAERQLVFTAAEFGLQMVESPGMVLFEQGPDA